MRNAATEIPPDIGMWAGAIDAKYKGVEKPYGKEEFGQLLGHCMVRWSLFFYPLLQYVLMTQRL
jgi:hypothetical protein